MHRKFSGFVAAALLLAGCAQGASAPTPRGDAIGTSVAATLTSLAQTLPAPTDTAAPPTLTPTATVPPRAFDRLIWMCGRCTGRDAWLITEQGAAQTQLPVSLGQFYDYSPASDRILYASEFASQGAGPSNIAVSDLWDYRFYDNTAAPIVEGNVVVEGQWAPNGFALAYILATPTTYELHWRDAAGEDRLLASDVTFTWGISPAGDRVAFSRESGYGLNIDPGFYIVSVDSGEIMKISDLDKGGTGSTEDRPSWSLDGQWLLLSNYGGPGRSMALAAADGSSSVEVTFDPALEGEDWYNEPLSAVLWHPDGHHLVGLPPISSTMGGPSPLILYDLDVESGRILSGVTFGEADQLIAWDRPGVSLWVMAGGAQPTLITLPLPAGG